MKRIYKYPIPVDDRIVIKMPEGAFVMSVQMQKSEPQIWVLCNPDKPLKERIFYLFGTGMEVSQEFVYLGTFQMLGGSLVYHLFEGQK